jgi:bifunctional DNA-binding transcriptional regulator/antitoxin component of YhaV-PrlF toxin-antitoxin module
MFKENRVMITTVTGKNQVTIPADLARKYHIEPGARLEWAEGERDDEIRIRVQPGPSELLRQVRELGAKYAGRAPDSAEAIRRMREEEDADVESVISPKKQRRP